MTFNVESEFLSRFVHGYKTAESRDSLVMANLALKQQRGKVTIGLVVVRRGTSKIFRNCRVAGSERIKRCPSASEPRTGSHKSAVYWGYHVLHGEWWRLCHEIWQVVWHSSQCLKRWWVENSEPPQTNMYAYWSSPKMGDDCHWWYWIMQLDWPWLVSNTQGVWSCKLTIDSLPLQMIAISPDLTEALRKQPRRNFP